MRRVLILSAVFPPEPVVSAKLSFDIAEALSKEDAVTVISPSPSRPYLFEFRKDNETHGFKHLIAGSYVCPQSKMLGRLRESISFGRYCYNYIEANSKDIDVIYANTWPLFAQFFSVRAARKLQVPIIVHVQDIYPESLGNKVPILGKLINLVLFPIDKYVLRKADKVIAISENMKCFLVKTRKIESDKVILVPNWQDEEIFLKYFNSKAGGGQNILKQFTFMYLGNNGPLAGVDLLIRSFVKSQLSDSKLTIAGTGSKTSDCMALAASLKATNIDFLTVPEGLVPEYQGKADVMLLPVRKNGAMTSIPSKLPAYMLSAKPVIGCLDMDSDTANVIRDAACGIVVEPENEEALIDAMRTAFGWDKQKLEELGQSGFNYAMLNFSRKANLKKLITVIRSVL